MMLNILLVDCNVKAKQSHWYSSINQQNLRLKGRNTTFSVANKLVTIYKLQMHIFWFWHRLYFMPQAIAT